jgi:cyclase
MENENPKSESMFFGASPFVFEKAKELRKRLTDTEKLLWGYLSRQQLGVKFRRQHPLSHFIADFYCHELKFVIEVDGGIHSSRKAKDYDAMRTSLLNEYGIDVIRFNNEEVIDNLEDVVEKIIDYIERRRLQKE